MRGVLLDKGSLYPDDLDFRELSKQASTWDEYEHTAVDQIAARIAQAQVIVANKTKLDAQTIREAKQLKLICVAATGTDNVDIAAARERGIAVTNVPGYATASVVQHVFLLMFALLGRFGDYQTALRAGAWSRNTHFSMLPFPINEVAGKTIGIVGYGTLGRHVANLARGFNMNILVAARKNDTHPAADRTRFTDVLENVDVLSLHCPLTSDNRAMIGRDAFERMRSTAVLINTARGALVDEAALADALRQGQIAGAGIDVLSQEPPPLDHPLLGSDIPNLILTPHVAWGSCEARQRLVNEIALNIQAFGNGERRNRIC